MTLGQRALAANKELLSHSIVDDIGLRTAAANVDVLSHRVMGDTRREKLTADV